jgi:hypothetical protein
MASGHAKMANGRSPKKTAPSPLLFPKRIEIVIQEGTELKCSQPPGEYILSNDRGRRIGVGLHLHPMRGRQVVA